MVRVSGSRGFEVVVFSLENFVGVGGRGDWGKEEGFRGEGVGKGFELGF